MNKVSVKIVDWNSEERQRQLYQRQKDFRRECFFASLGFLLIGAIVLYNLLK